MKTMPNLYTVELPVERQDRRQGWEVVTPFMQGTEQAEAALAAITEHFPAAVLRTYTYRSEEETELACGLESEVSHAQ